MIGTLQSLRAATIHQAKNAIVNLQAHQIRGLTSALGRIQRRGRGDHPGGRGLGQHPAVYRTPPALPRRELMNIHG